MFRLFAVFLFDHLKNRLMIRQRPLRPALDRQRFHAAFGQEVKHRQHQPDQYQILRSLCQRHMELGISFAQDLQIVDVQARVI